MVDPCICSSFFQFLGGSNAVLAPPELKSLVPECAASSRKPPLPPWLLPAAEETTEKPLTLEKETPKKEEIFPAQVLPIEAAVLAYPEQLVKQLDVSLSAGTSSKAVWDESSRPVPEVVVGGKALPLNQLTNDHVLEMSTDEYRQYFEIHNEEWNARFKLLLM